MFKNYIKTALRNIGRYKGFSIINILGLSIALTGCLMIGLFVWDELQYDKFIRGGENIYRIYSKTADSTGTVATASVAPMMATHIKQQFPEVESTNRIMMLQAKVLAKVGDVQSFEEKWLVTEPSFFEFFPLPFLKGDPKTALEDPHSIVITENFAKRFFGSEDPLGKRIAINRSELFVKGVLANLPEHFHLDFNFIMPLAAIGIPKERMESWGWQQFFTYVKLKPGTDAGKLESKFQASVKTTEPVPDRPGGVRTVPYLQPLHNIHLRSSSFVNDNAKRGNADYVKALTIIAIFVLIIAIFNFINLSTARSFRRAKEIGVRKVVGAERMQLLFQFTGETVLFALFAVMIAVVAAFLLLPYLNSFSDKSISFNPFINPLLGLAILGGAVVIGIIAGIYPAVFMSGFKPIKVLKGLIPMSAGSGFSSTIRKGLVVVQFALSALLIVCTIVVYRQVNFLHTKDLGFNKDQVIFFDVHGDVAKHPNAFKDELLRSQGVVSATAGYGLPGDKLAGDAVIVPTKNGDQNHPVNLFIVDHDYIKTLGLELVAGRDFSKELVTDSSQAFIINETAVKEFGFGTPAQALEQPLNWNKWENDSLNPQKKGRVIGVVKDFHFKSLHEKVNAAVLQIYPQAMEKFAVKVKAADLQNTIAFIKNTWDRFSPNFPFDYKFLDENFAAMYKAEDKLGTLLWIFTIMAIFVGCLGLFGLAAFSAEQRRKEIGIRKVLGASVAGIIAMLSKSFLRPVLLASLLAFPLAWWAMNKWLQDFPYRISITWWVFVLAAVASLLIAFITVSFQSVKTAMGNPVKSLRSE